MTTSSSPSARTHTSAPTRPGGVEYRTLPNRIVWSVFTIRVVPSATVCGRCGSGCSRVRSVSSRSAGTAHVSRCTRPFTTAQNRSHAAVSSGKL